MSNPYAEHMLAVAVERIASTLERVAIAVERYADADPMTVLHEAMQGENFAGDPPIGHAPADEPLEPYAGNGSTFVYRHPDPRFEVVLRQDQSAESGYVAKIEKA